MSPTSLLVVDRDAGSVARSLLDLAADAFLTRRRLGAAGEAGTFVLEASGWGGAPRNSRRLGAKVVSPNAVLGPEAMKSDVLERVFASSRELIQLTEGTGAFFPDHGAVDLGLLNLLRIQYYLRDFYTIQTAAETLLEAEGIDRCHLLSTDPSFVSALSHNLARRGVDVTSSTPKRLKRSWERARWARLRLRAAVTSRPAPMNEQLEELEGLEPAVLFVSESKPMDQMFRRVESVLAERGSTPVVRVGLAKAQRDPELSPHVRHLFLESSSDGAVAARARHRAWRRVLDRLGGAESVVGREGSEHIPVRSLFAFVHREIMGTQIAHIERTERVLDTLRPGVVVVGNDHFWVGQTYVQLARSRGIPTVAVQDGAAYDAPPWWWSTADVTAASGRALTEYLTRHGTPEDRCVVTGQPRYDRLTELVDPEKQEAARRRLGLANGELLVLFATQYGQDEEYVRSVVDALISIPDSRVVLRPHPSQEADVHRRIAGEVGREKITLREHEDILDLVGACHVLVAHNSTVILEAAYLGKPIIVANFGDLPERLPYEELASAAVVRRPEDLVEVAADLAAKLRADGAGSSRDVKDSVDPILGPVDGRAGERVADLLETLLDGRVESPTARRKASG